MKPFKYKKGDVLFYIHENIIGVVTGISFGEIYGSRFRLYDISISDSGYSYSDYEAYVDCCAIKIGVL